VALLTSDPLTRAGIAAYLEERPDLTLLAEPDADADVLVADCRRFTREFAAVLRRATAVSGCPTVLITEEFVETETIRLIECRVVAVVPRSGVTAVRFPDLAIAAARGRGVMPEHLVDDLLRQIRNVTGEPAGGWAAITAGLSPAELEVLRMIAGGLSAAEISERLASSERNVSAVVQGVVRRLQLRNRAHAVAYAVRLQLI
jgi:DNA-binding NarL/FixJ family response regulator